MPKPYRILHVLDSFGLGGAQEVALNLAKYGDRERFDIEVAILHGAGIYWKKFREMGIKTYSFSPGKYVPLYIPRMFHLCRKRKYHLVHTHLFGSNMIAKPLAALAGVLVRSNHDHSHSMTRRENRCKTLADKFMNRFSTHIIAVSSSTREFLVKREGIPPGKITVVPNGVDTRRFHPQPEKREEALRKWGLSGDKINIAGIGRLHYAKNYPLFLRIAANLLKEKGDIHFVIAGEGPKEREIKTLCSSLNIMDHVSFLGYVKDMTTLYPAIDILLITSRFEAMPMNVLEAMACRIPIVAPALGGLAEIFEDEKDSFLIRDYKDKAFLKKLSVLVHDSETRRNLAEAAFHKVVSQFSAEAMTKKVEDLYLKFIDLTSKSIHPD